MLPVVYMPASEKYFRKLKDQKLKKLFLDAIIAIRIDPFIGVAKMGDLNGIYCYDIYHNSSNYELAYRVTKLDNGEIIVIIMAGKRENFYKELKKYLK